MLVPTGFIIKIIHHCRNVWVKSRWPQRTHDGFTYCQKKDMDRIMKNFNKHHFDSIYTAHISCFSSHKKTSLMLYFSYKFTWSNYLRKWKSSLLNLFHKSLLQIMNFIKTSTWVMKMSNSSTKLSLSSKNI